MQYTSIHPEEPGWYWWEEESGYPPVVIELTAEVVRFGTSLCRTRQGYKKITELCGRFAGPIPEPFDDRPWFCKECKHDGNTGPKCHNCLMPRT